MTITEVAGLVSQFGVAGFALVMWYLERDERRDAQKANTEMFERTLIALIENKRTVETLKEIFGGKNGG